MPDPSVGALLASSYRCAHECNREHGDVSTDVSITFVVEGILLKPTDIVRHMLYTCGVPCVGTGTNDH